ncbi:MAG: MBL fold metallo-hydrolase [Candidatus Aenigmatarchaeota archaeon]
MEILPIAFDSLGTRSMACLVATKNNKILIDPGVSLAPIRYGLQPHSTELKRLEEHWKKIVEFAMRSQVLVITHYHYDHFNPLENLEIYKRKIVLIKHPTEKINFSQKQRASFFLEKIKDLPESLDYVDGKEFKFGRTEIIFSQPVFHGTSQKLGWVVEVLMKEGNEKLIFTSDVEGPAIKDQVEFILENKPDFLIVDGPMTYMLGYRYGYENFQASVKNLIKILEEVPPKTLILDHHFLRDLKYKEKMSLIFKTGKEMKTNVLTAAEFLGKPVEMLEAMRKELYQKYPETKFEEKKIVFEE